MSNKAYKQFKGQTAVDKKKSNTDATDEKERKKMKILQEAEASNMQIERMRKKSKKQRTASASAGVSSVHEAMPEEKKETESDGCVIGETKVEINKTPDPTGTEE